jgi:hypothetical protein
MKTQPQRLLEEIVPKPTASEWTVERIRAYRNYADGYRDQKLAENINSAIAAAEEQWE